MNMRIFVFSILALAWIIILKFAVKEGESYARPVDWSNAFNTEKVTAWLNQKSANYKTDSEFFLFIQRSYGKEAALRHITLKVMQKSQADMRSDSGYRCAYTRAKFLLLKATAEQRENEFSKINEFCSNSYSSSKTVICALN